MLLTVRLFGRFGDLGERESSLDVSAEVTCADVRTQLSNGDETLGRALASPRTIVAVNRQVVDWDHVLREGDEIAFLPPVTGG